MLRDYQKEICAKVNEAFAVHRSVMMQMPTGTGKTVVLASLVRQFVDSDGSVSMSGAEDERGCSVLIVAHRIELVEQTGAFLRRFGIDHGVIAGGQWPAALQRVMVASIQTLSRCTDRHRRLAPSLVVIDEAHHALAETYKMLWRAWPEARFLGLTATPCRMSGEGFTDLFEVLVDSWSVKRFIAEGWLSPYDYYSIRPDSEEQRNIDALRKRGADGDFQLRELRERLDVRPSIRRLFEAFGRFAFDKKGIIYAIDIAHAEHIAEYYREQGVAAYAISSKTPMAERQRLLAVFRGKSGDGAVDCCISHIQILVSVDLFSEGFDCPDVEFVQLARPTLSLAKYLQMVGRGLRPCKGKPCCTMIDSVGLYRMFGLPSVDRDWGTFFYGLKDERFKELKNNDLDLNFLGLHHDSLSDGHLVKIVSHEGMPSQFEQLGRAGLERRKKYVWSGGKRKAVWVWKDMVNGVEFDRHPKVIYYRGLEMSTADGETFFPRICSKWIDAKHGINRKALETQVGDGIGWMKRYVSLAMPDKVLQLQAVRQKYMRIYRDEQGVVFVQQDLDHAPVSEVEAGGRKAFMALCSRERQAWEEMVTSIGRCTLKWDDKKGWWKIAGGLLRKRGFVELLQDGDVVYVLNIREERFMPYHNWEIRADERICTIGNKLYFCKEKDEMGYRIKKRSDDFRMFVVEERCRNDNMTCNEWMIINETGRELEIKKR